MLKWGSVRIAKEATAVDWQIRAIRGATTVPENSVEAIAAAVTELLDAVELGNPLDPERIVSVTFSATRDLDSVFPAAIARSRPQWDDVPLLDVQQMHVKGSLPRCIRLMIHLYLPAHQSEVSHAYLRGARHLRPDLCLTSD
ncbi:chorismate mutase [Leptolyngbya sp. BC1307]|uniref:chorismate mutase n=1 Tax=Leptolyngbya sp. BC1307 TaxID=2029589 RepID=UPI000EFAD3D6